MEGDGRIDSLFVYSLWENLWGGLRGLAVESGGACPAASHASEVGKADAGVEPKDLAVEVPG